MKNKYRFSAVLFTAILLCIFIFPCSATDETETEPLVLEAKAAVLVEMNTNTLLFEQNSEEIVYPASLTKIMTCLLAIENGNLDDVLTVSATALDGLNPDGSTANLQVGENMTLENLLYCMMVESANDACNVVAEYISGSVDQFVELMNERATLIGCSATHFANPHGLHDDNHYTTAYDMAKIAITALQNDTFLKLCTTTEYTVPATNLSEERELITTNYLVSEVVTNRYYYGYASGVKTGYTSQAGRCLITTAKYNDMYLLSVVMGAETGYNEDGSLALGNFVESKKLLKYGIVNFDYVTVLSQLDTLAQINVNLSADTETVVAVPEESITALLPTDYDAEQVESKIEIDSPDGIDAPVETGEKLGTVTVTYEGNELGTTNLVAMTDVSRSEFEYFKQQLKTFLQHYWWILLLALFGFLLVIYILYYIFSMIKRRRKYRRQRK